MGDVMDIEELVSKMNDEEKHVFEYGSANEYYEYVLNELELDKKLKSIKGNEDDDIFLFILEKLYLVVGKAIMEDGTYSFVDEIVKRLLIRIMRLKRLPEEIFNECYKFLYLLESIKMGIDINEDLLDGHDMVYESGEIKDLEILYKQHEEASLFRTNQEYFGELYESLPNGVVDVNMRSAVYAMKNGYDREKQLVKRYDE